MKKYLTVKFVIFIVLSFFVFLPSLAAAVPLTVHMLNIETEDAGYGRSDCFIVHLPNNTKMIIDCPVGGTHTLLNKLDALGFDSVKFVVGTHEHSDHIGGLDKFLNQFANISHNQIYYPYGSVNADGASYIDLKNAAAARGMTVKKLKRGDYILNTTAHDKPLQVRALHPSTAFGDASGAECIANNGSLVLKVRYGTRSILFMGDAMNTAEHDIVNSFVGDELTKNGPQVIKVGHHGQWCGGDYYPCCNYFMNNAPNLNRALVTCGDKPWADCRDQLKAYGVRYWTTGINGDVWLQTYGDSSGWTESEPPAWQP